MNLNTTLISNDREKRRTEREERKRETETGSQMTLKQKNLTRRGATNQEWKDFLWLLVLQ